MVHYDKKVIYLSEMEYGNRRKGAGFVRMECRGESCSFDMHVSGMGTLAERKYDVTVISVWGKEYRIGKLFIHNGSGEWREVYEKGRVTEAGTEREGKEGIPYREIAEIRVKISDTKVLMGKTPFCENIMQAAEIAAEETTEERGRGVTGGRKGREDETGTEEMAKRGRKEKIEHEPVKAVKESWKEKERAGTEEGLRSGWNERKENRTGEDIRNGRKENGTGENVRNGRREGRTGEDTRNGRKEGERTGTGQRPERDAEEGRGIWKFVRGGMEHTEKGDRQKAAGEEEKIQIDDVILNDKWDQLKQLYSVVHPYEDDRQYIAIQPKDFVIMTGDYQHLANNSFLLHGFYNYRHIVLGRERDGCFYLGVPGVYYEREKMVALMFGFEAFECTGGNAEAGKFGYYLRKVKI